MTKVKPTDCICSYNTHRPEGEGTRTDVSRNPKCPVHNPPKTIVLNEIQSYLLNDIARRAAAIRRHTRSLRSSCDDVLTMEMRLGFGINLDAALKADVEWKQMESSLDALNETLDDSSDYGRLRKLAITPEKEGSDARRWFKEGEEV